MTTCSTVQIDSMPHRSAVVARCARSCGLLNGPELTNMRPSFIAITSLVVQWLDSWNRIAVRIFAVAQRKLIALMYFAEPGAAGDQLLAYRSDAVRRKNDFRTLATGR